MRTAILTGLILGLTSSPAMAITKGHNGGGNNSKPTVVRVINKCPDTAVTVSISGSASFDLEAGGGSHDFIFPIDSGKKIDQTVAATIPGASIGASQPITVQSGKDITAIVTSPTSTSLAITISSGLAAIICRESGVMLASAGGLLPLLWFGFLLGSRPRRNPLTKQEEEMCGGSVRDES